MPLAHFLKASPFKGFAHTFGSQGLPSIDTQIGKDFRSGHIGAMGIIISWFLEAAQQQFRFCGLHLEILALPVKLRYLFIVEPIVETCVEQGFGFRIDTVHRDSLCTFYINGKHLKGQEPSAACGVCQEVVAVHRCHETRQVWVFLHILVVGHAVFDHRAGYEVLQFVLIPLVECFELVVDVYDKVLPDIGERVLFLRIYLAV